MKLAIGTIDQYPFGTRTILMVNHRTVLIECRNKSDEVTQYIVTTGVFIDDAGHFSWSGNGRYFLSGKDAYDSFLQAVDSMRKSIFLLVRKSDEDETVVGCTTYDDASFYLEKALGDDRDIQAIAMQLGITIDTFSYFAHQDEFRLRGAENEYTIIECEMNQVLKG